MTNPQSPSNLGWKLLFLQVLPSLLIPFVVLVLLVVLFVGIWPLFEQNCVGMFWRVAAYLLLFVLAAIVELPLLRAFLKLASKCTGGYVLPFGWQLSSAKTMLGYCFLNSVFFMASVVVVITRYPGIADRISGLGWLGWIGVLILTILFWGSAFIAVIGLVYFLKKTVEAKKHGKSINECLENRLKDSPEKDLTADN